MGYRVSLWLTARAGRTFPGAARCSHLVQQPRGNLR